MNIISKYSEYYTKKDVENLYPTEFVVRAFLGSNGIFETKAKSFIGKSVLDLGFGDGRNIPFLCNLKMNVFGMEISQTIVDKCKLFLENKGHYPNLVYTNEQTYFKSSSFHYILGCHSIYYILKARNLKIT